MTNLNKKSLFIGIILLLLSTIGIAMSMMPLPPGNELKEMMREVPRLNQELNTNPEILNNTRLRDLDLSGLVLKNARLTNLNWRNVKLTGALIENVTIEKAKWVGVKCDECIFRTVTFKEAKLDQDSEILHGATSFNKSRMDDVHFINSHLLDVRMIEFEPSRIYFERTTVKNRVHTKGNEESGVIIEGELKAYIKDSYFDNATLGNLTYPSEVIIENSKITGEESLFGGVYERLKRLEIKNSYFDGFGPKYSDFTLVENSQITMGLPSGKVLILTNNAYVLDKEERRTAFTRNNAEHLMINGCQNKHVGFLSIRKSSVVNLYITGCDFEKVRFKESSIGKLLVCNSKITESDWRKAQIRDAQFHDFSINDLLKTEGLKIGHLQTENSQLPAELIRAAKKQSPLSGGCPPLPDIEALKQKALSTDPPPPLSSLLQEKFSDPENPPFRDYGILSVGGMLFYREDWISHYHAMNGGLGVYTEPPAIAGAVLRLQEPGEALPMDEMILEPGEWRTGLTHQGEPCRALLLHAPVPPEPFHLPYHMGICPNAQLTLELRFAPVASPARFDVEQPWSLTLQSAEPIERVWGGSLSDETREALLAKKDLLTQVVWG